MVRLDNPQATLIEEEWVLTLQKGLNKVDFSWKGVSINVYSIRLRVLSHPDKVNRPLQERIRITRFQLPLLFTQILQKTTVFLVDTLRFM